MHFFTLGEKSPKINPIIMGICALVAHLQCFRKQMALGIKINAVTETAPPLHHYMLSSAPTRRRNDWLKDCHDDIKNVLPKHDEQGVTKTKYAQNTHFNAIWGNSLNIPIKTCLKIKESVRVLLCVCVIQKLWPIPSHVTEPPAAIERAKGTQQSLGVHEPAQHPSATAIRPISF